SIAVCCRWRRALLLYPTQSLETPLVSASRPSLPYCFSRFLLRAAVSAAEGAPGSTSTSTVASWDGVRLSRESSALRSALSSVVSAALALAPGPRQKRRRRRNQSWNRKTTIGKKRVSRNIATIVMRGMDQKQTWGRLSSEVLLGGKVVASTTMPEPAGATVRTGSGAGRDVAWASRPG